MSLCAELVVVCAEHSSDALVDQLVASKHTGTSCICKASHLKEGSDSGKFLK